MVERMPFKLFTNCRLVRGAGRSTICDLERNTVHLIPNSLNELLSKYQGKTIDYIKDDLNHEHDETIDEYFDFLIANDLIIFDYDLTMFPEIDFRWETPCKIIYCILDIDINKAYETVDLALQLTELDCQYLEIRSYSQLDISDYVALIQPFNGSTITSINLLLPYDEKITELQWHNAITKYEFVTGLTLHGCPDSLLTNNEGETSFISYVGVGLENEKCCGVIKSDHFVAYIDTFSESLQFNSCLNRKISVDRNGEIKNCPSMNRSFGNITSTTLSEALSRSNFRVLWGITKDQVETCKDCEFRYVCTDCRAYLEKPVNILSKPLKCGYNPYTCEWEEWSSNPLKQKAKHFYQM